ncbi:MAG TPA: acyltransferase domain-containing protein, partial [Thermomicrobiales bacterium]|nr:acyltransferase domain-containing protein [Thermomicrobiales bacterium]
MTETSSNVTDVLRAKPEHRAWLEYLQGLDTEVVEPFVPGEEELLGILRYLDVPEEYLQQAIAARPDPSLNPDQWWLLERCVASLVHTMGDPTPPPWFPSPMELRGLDPYFYVHVFVATLPYVRDYHRKHGVPEEITRATLADLGRNVRVHHKRYGVGGMGVAFWLMLHFRGAIYQL